MAQPFSAQQRRVLNTKGVTLLGVDEKGRPVVEAQLGIPNQLRRWALLRSGDPADVTGEITLWHHKSLEERQS